MKRTSCLAVIVVGSTLLGAAAFAGCGVSPAVTVVHLRPGEKTEPIQGDIIKVRRGGQEAYVGIRGGYYAVRTIDDWHSAWPSGTEPPLPATLDTSRSMLLMGVADRKDTVGIRIEKVLETSDRIHVFVRETAAGEGCPERPDRVPLDAVVAPRLDKPVKFYVEEARAETCGEPPGVNVQCRLNDAPQWGMKLAAQPGDTIDCTMKAETRGKFALIDTALTLGQLPGGSSAKLAYTKGPGRGDFTVDVFGTYTVRGEATDEAHRQALSVATIEAMPPKTHDVLVQLVWTNFDVSDDPDTFPRVQLRAAEVGADGKPRGRECSLDTPRADLCEVKSHSAYTHMKLKASDKHVKLDVRYVDERIEKGPLVCVQLYFDGVRTGETCDRKRREADEHWAIGVVEMDKGKIAEPAQADAGAGDGGMEGGADGGATDGGRKAGSADAGKRR